MNAGRKAAGATAMLLGYAAVMLPPTHAGAQEARPRHEVTETPFGLRLDFHPDGAWRVRAREVAARRAQLLRAGEFSGLNAAVAGRSTAWASAVTGTVQVPAILFRYQDRGFGAGRDTSEMRVVLFGDVPPFNRPYTVRTYYEELSSGLVSVQGAALGWFTLPGDESDFAGTPGTCSGNPFGTANCNGIFSQVAFSALNGGLRQLLDSADAIVDFGEFDNDGPDGMPNSGDDDGIVDMVLFVHSELDGACGGSTNNHVWAHKASALSGAVSDDPSNVPGVDFVRFRDYTIQSGVGGSSGCDSTSVMPVGTTAHETGHAFGLPDLYDVSGVSEGIGRWGLMGSGNWSTQFTPGRMMAWSLNRLGWISLEPITVSGTYGLGPAPLADSAYIVQVQGTNQRNEYFLLENRQAVLGDSAVIRVACGVSGVSFPGSCAGGLAIWHIDDARIASGGGVNTGSIHGVGLVQADGLNQLRASSGGNRGDGGDLFPGVTANTSFGANSTPAAFSHAGEFVGFVVDSVRQEVVQGEMAFRIRFGTPTLVQASDTLARVRVDGDEYTSFFDLLEDGSTHTVSVDSVQTSGDGRRQWLFQSWSDGGDRTHDITGMLQGDTLIATLLRRFQVQATVTGDGAVVSDSVADPAVGALLGEGSAIRLVAAAAAGSVFEAWSGDTTVFSDTLDLVLSRPFQVNAAFAPALLADPGTVDDAVMGHAYRHEFEAVGGTGTYSWRLINSELPDGLRFAAGVINGTPTETGTWTLTALVTSGFQSAGFNVTLTVTAPQLTTADVLGQLLGTGATLSSEDRTYLDLLGNRNGSYDVGDFLAWVTATGATVSVDALGRVLDLEDTR